MASYTEDEYYGGVFGHRKRRMRKKNIIPAPKQPQIQDFQFYPEKLKPLLQKELDIWKKQCALAEQQQAKKDERSAARAAVREAARLAEGREGEEDEESSDEEDDAEDEAEMAAIKGLSDKQLKEKDRLIASGFGTWTKKEFNQFCHGSELFGRDELDQITDLISARLWKRSQSTRIRSGKGLRSFQMVAESSLRLKEEKRG